MAAPTIKYFTLRGANPGSGFLTDSPSTTATGAKTVYFPPTTMAGKIAVMFKVLSTCVADLEVSCSNPQSIAADSTAGIWKAASAALTGVTGGAIVYAVLDVGVTAIRMNVTTGLAGNQATVELSGNNPNY